MVRILLAYTPLQLRVGGLVVLACVLGILLASVLTVRFGRSELRHEIGVQTEQIAVQVTRALDSGLDAARADLLQFAALPAMRDASAPDADTVRVGLRRLQAQAPAFAWIAFVLPGGTIRAATASQLEGRAVTGQDWFRPALPRGTAPAGAATAEDTATPRGRDGEPAESRFPTLVVAVTDGSGQVHGYLAGRMNEAWAEKAQNLYFPLLMSQFTNLADIVIANADGKKLLGPGRGQPALDAVPRGIAVRAGRGWYSSGRGASESITGYAATMADPSGAVWIALVRRPELTAGGLQDAAIVGAVLSGLVVAAAGIVLSVQVVNQASAPIARLADSAMRIGRGIRASDIKSEAGGRDILRLSHALRSLVRRLDIVQRQLHDATVLAGANSARQAREIEALHRLAVTDPMTGLLNRRGLALAVDELLVKRPGHRALGVLLIDIDHFKRVNDVHGHAAGDNVIRAVAATVVNTVRQGDLVARLGGEEFVVVLPDTTGEALYALGDRIRVSVEDLHTAVPDGMVHVTMCAGAALMQPADTDIQDVIDRADVALYRAKAAGRNRVCTASDVAVG